MKIKLTEETTKIFNDFDFSNFLRNPVLTDSYNKMGPNVGSVEKINEENIEVLFKNNEIEEKYKKIKNLEVTFSYIKNRKGKLVVLTINIMHNDNSK